MVIRRLAVVLILAVTGATALILKTQVEPRARPHPQQQQLTSATVAGPSEADVHYAHMMVLHHEQAIRMSRAMLAKPAVPERIRLIADFIAHDQQREVTSTNEWLTAWGQDPVAAGATADGHGMLTEAQLKSLDRAPTAKATDEFLRLMIEHHRGALTMSRTLLDGDGRNAYTHKLAKHVINEQSAEIEAMQALLT